MIFLLTPTQQTLMTKHTVYYSGQYPHGLRSLITRFAGKVLKHINPSNLALDDYDHWVIHPEDVTRLVKSWFNKDDQDAWQPQLTSDGKDTWGWGFVLAYKGALPKNGLPLGANLEGVAVFHHYRPSEKRPPRPDEEPNPGNKGEEDRNEHEGDQTAVDLLLVTDYTSAVAKGLVAFVEEEAVKRMKELKKDPWDRMTHNASKVEAPLLYNHLGFSYEVEEGDHTVPVFVDGKEADRVVPMYKAIGK